MPSLDDQLKWEREMFERGISRFRAQEDAAWDKKDFIRTAGGAKLLKTYLGTVSEYISLWLGNSVQGKAVYAKRLAGLQPDQLAMFALVSIIQGVYQKETMRFVASELGMYIQDELRFQKFAKENKKYYDGIMRSLKERHTESYRHRHRVLCAAMQRKKINWKEWPQKLVHAVGLSLLGCATQATDFIHITHERKGKKTYAFINPTDELMEWVAQRTDALEILLPDRMPCLIEPRPWESWKSGGYYSPRISRRTPLVKTRSGQTGKEHRDLLGQCDMPVVYGAVNAMQGTAWSINNNVLETMQHVWDKGVEVAMPRSKPLEIPPAPLLPDNPEDWSEQNKIEFADWKLIARELYVKERSRRGEIVGVSRSIRMGQKLARMDELFIVYQADFRGRLYATSSGVSPQGGDQSRSLLHFSKGEPLGDNGEYWWKVHGANKHGFDKASYDDRVKWIDDQREKWIAIADNPLGMHEHWANDKATDKPWQFLAWCHEFAEHSRDPDNFRSKIPIALDGSCNGLQHFSAMLRDPVGGSAVNLTPQDKPADIYQRVADVCYDKVRAAADPVEEHYDKAMLWLSVFEEISGGRMPRKASKTPVMTLPYGSTRSTCTESLFEWYQQQECDIIPRDSIFSACVWLSGLLWESISEVVVAARHAMNWLQTCAGKLASKNIPVSYTTPLGFPVYQASRSMRTTQVSATIGGSRFTLRVSEQLKGLNARWQRQGSSPNFVHSIDATHMMKCVSAGYDRGIRDFAMIHDDFGVHARHIDKWHGIIRDEFVDLHSTDLLAAFREAHSDLGVDLPEVPAKGNLDLSQVKDSKYFFG